MNQRFLLALLAATLLPACSGATAEAPTDQEESEDALATRALSNVAAIEFDKGRGAGSTFTIAEKTKVQKFIRAIKPTGRGAFCAVRSETRLKMFDAKAEVVAEGTLNCFKGTVELASGGTIPVVLKPSDLQVLQEPLVVADALWAIDKIELTRRSSPPIATHTLTAKSSIDDVLDAIDSEQAIDTQARLPRCLPSRTIGFFRKGREVASAGYSCAATGTLPASVNASFSINVGGDTSGVIELDPRPIEALLP